MKSLLLLIIIFSVSFSCDPNTDSLNAKSNLAIQSKELKNDNLVDTNDKFKFISNFNDYQSLNDLINIESFKGNILYITIWTIFCDDCIQEFKYYRDLTKRYENESVIFIYLIDMMAMPGIIGKRDSIISEYQLVGYHMQMSSKFYNQITKIKNINFYKKPHFILLDRNGIIVDANADKPSSKNIIINSIDSLLNKFNEQNTIY